MLDGYLTAIVVGPCSIPPDEWFVDLLGARGRIATAPARRWRRSWRSSRASTRSAKALSAAPEQHAPIFEKTDDGTVLPHPWCMGFLAAMQLRLKAWQPLLDLSSIEHGLMLPILLHCIDPLGGPMLGPPREGRRPHEFLRTAYHDIPLVIPAIATSGCRSAPPKLAVNPEAT